MPNDTDKTIQEHLESLPPYVKDALRAAQPIEKIRKIATDFKLHIDEAQRLEQEVMLVLFGLESPDTFIDETSKTFKLSPEDTQKLVERVGNDLFLPIRDAMRRYMESLAQQEKEAAAEVPQQDGAAEPAALQVPPQTDLPAAPQTEPQTPPAPPAEPKTQAQQLFERAPTPEVPVPAEAPKPAPKAPSPLDDALSAPTAAPAQKVDVGIAPAKQGGYKVDPYREPV